MIVILNLGGVIFQEFEIPETISDGISQGLDIKKYVGGQRTIDAMGIDYDPLEWSGRFRGPNAEDRYKALKVMAAAGLPVKASWSSFSYQVMIAKISSHYQQPFEIPYTIRLEIISDNTQPPQSFSATLDSIVNSDMGQALGLGDALTAVQDTVGDAVDSIEGESNDLGITDALQEAQKTINDNIPNVVTSLNDLQQGLSTIQRLTGVNTGVLASLSSDIVSAQGVTQTAIGAISGQILPTPSTVFGSTAGLAPETIAANVAGQASSMSALANLLPLSDVLGRMGKNVATVNQ